MNSTFRSFAILCLAFTLRSVAAEPPVTSPAARLTVTPSGDVEVAMADGAVARFAPVVAMLVARADPNLEMRWGQFPEAAMKLSDTGSIYNVLTWGPKNTGAKTAAQHVEDGFDPAVDRG